MAGDPIASRKSVFQLSHSSCVDRRAGTVHPIAVAAALENRFSRRHGLHGMYLARCSATVDPQGAPNDFVSRAGAIERVLCRVSGVVCGVIAPYHPVQRRRGALGLLHSSYVLQGAIRPRSRSSNKQIASPSCAGDASETGTGGEPAVPACEIVCCSRWLAASRDYHHPHVPPSTSALVKRNPSTASARIRHRQWPHQRGPSRG